MHRIIPVSETKRSRHNAAIRTQLSPLGVNKSMMLVAYQEALKCSLRINSAIRNPSIFERRPDASKGMCSYWFEARS